MDTLSLQGGRAGSSPTLQREKSIRRSGDLPKVTASAGQGMGEEGALAVISGPASSGYRQRRLSLQQEMSDLRSCKQWPAGPPGTPDLGPPGQLGSRVKPSSEGSLGLLPAHLGHPHPKRLGRSSLSHSRLGRSRLGGTEGTTCLIEPTTPEEGRESDSIHQPPRGEPRAVLLSFKWPLPGVVPLPRQ